MKSTIVIDLNVFVRALLTSGIDKAIIEAIKNDKITPAFCRDMLKNLAAVFIRPHLKLDPRDIKNLLEAIREKATIVSPKTKINACRDASDNIILETAIESNARAIVTNDPDLIVLNPFRGISIITPRQFIRTTKKAQ